MAHQPAREEIILQMGWIVGSVLFIPASQLSNYLRELTRCNSATMTVVDKGTFESLSLPTGPPVPALSALAAGFK